MDNSVKATIQIFYGKRTYDTYVKNDKALKKYLTVNKRQRSKREENK